MIFWFSARHGSHCDAPRRGTRKSTQTPNRQASDQTVPRGPADRPASDATCQTPRCCTRYPAKSSETERNRPERTPYSRRTRSRTPRPNQTQPHDCCDRSTAPPASASTTPSHGTGYTAHPPRRSACNSGCRSARQTSRHSRTPHHRSTPTTHSARHREARRARAPPNPAASPQASC